MLRKHCRYQFRGIQSVVDGAPQAHVSKIINSLQPLEIQEMIKMSVCLLFLDGVKNYKFVNIKLDFRPSQISYIRKILFQIKRLIWNTISKDALLKV